MAKTVRLSGVRDILAQITLLPVSVQKSETDKNGVPYRLASYNGTAFTVREEFVRDFNNGKVADLALVEDVRETEDAEGNAATVSSLSYAKHLTIAQIKGAITGDAEIAKAEKFAMESAVSMEEASELV